MTDPFDSYRALDRPHRLSDQARREIAESIERAYSDELSVISGEPDPSDEFSIELVAENSPPARRRGPRFGRSALLVAAVALLLLGSVIVLTGGDDAEKLTTATDERAAGQIEDYCARYVAALAVSLDALRVNPTLANIDSGVGALESAVVALGDLSRSLDEPYGTRAAFAFDSLSAGVNQLGDAASVDAFNVETVAADLAAALGPFPGAGACGLDRLATRQTADSTFYDGFRPAGDD